MSNFTTYADNAKAKGHNDLARRIRIEGRIARALVAAILADGNTASVNDDSDGHGEWTVKRSTDAKVIVDALFTTDGDLIVARNAAGDKLGWFSLVYGNDGTDVVSDYSANDWSEAIWTETIQPLADGIELGTIRV